MKKMQLPVRRNIALLCLALLLLGGCSAGSPSATTTAASQSAQTTEETTTLPAETTSPAAKETLYKDGTYEGIGYGNNNTPVQVKIEIVDDRIVGLEVVRQNDTPDYFSKAWDSIYAEIMGQESPDLSEVDAVSGATNSSRGILDAVKAALYKARR